MSQNQNKAEPQHSTALSSSSSASSLESRMKYIADCKKFPEIPVKFSQNILIDFCCIFPMNKAICSTFNCFQITFNTVMSL